METLGRVILDSYKIQLIIDRLSWQLVENYDDLKNTCLVGIQPRGVFWAEKIYHSLRLKLNKDKIEFGKLDITFYRDDFNERGNEIKPSVTEMNFLVENKNVILIDDVLYSGRTVQAALTALNHYGRPGKIELMTLVDRRFNRHIPIRPDYNGIVLDAVDEAYVRVEWEGINSDKDQVLLFPGKQI